MHVAETGTDTREVVSVPRWIWYERPPFEVCGVMYDVIILGARQPTGALRLIWKQFTTCTSGLCGSRLAPGAEPKAE